MTILRAETQDYILDNWSELLKSKVIVGTGQNGVEYKIITIVLDLPKEILRFIQSFDFTKCPPKAYNSKYNGNCYFVGRQHNCCFFESDRI